MMKQKVIMLSLGLLLSSQVDLTHSLPSIGARDPVRLVDNKYEGLVVAVQNDIPQDPTLLANLMKRIQEMSDALYIATKFRARLGNVTILLPESWTTTAQTNPGHSYDTAHVILESGYSDSPYVYHVKSCGEAGEFMHLTPTYLLNEQQSTTDFGPYGRTLAHEFLHLVYGVRDEYPLAGERHFYVDQTGNPSPVTCTSGITVRPALSPDGPEGCSRDETGNYVAECLAVPTSGSLSSASLMGYHTLMSVTNLCDEGPSLATKHNYGAPTAQNRECGGRSVWEVLRSHEHFAGSSFSSGEGNDCQLDTFWLQSAWPVTSIASVSAVGGLTVSPNLQLALVSVSYLRFLGLEPNLVAKLAPYAGLDGKQANATLQTTPHQLTVQDILDIRYRVFYLTYSEVEQVFNQYTNGAIFATVARNYKSAMVSLARDYPPDQSLAWNYTYEHDWTAAAAEIEKLPLEATRRVLEADQLRLNVTDPPGCEERNSPDVGLNSSELAVNIEVVRAASGLRLVFVLDYSHSMNNWKMIRQLEAVRHYVYNLARTGDEIGIVAFASKDAEYVLRSMTKVETVEDRSQLASSLPTKTLGATCIACGINLAVQLLEAGNKSSVGTRLLVLSDGEETSSLRVDDVTPTLMAKRIRCDTIRISTQAAQSLESLASKTNGHAIIAPDINSSTALLDAMDEIYGQSSTSDFVEISHEVVSASGGTMRNHSFLIDSSSSSYIQVDVLHLSGSDSGTVKLLSPSGSVVHTTTNSLQFHYNASNVQAGTWRVERQSTSQSVYSVVVYANDTTNTRLSVSTATADGAPVVLAEFRQGKHMVIDALVTAKLYSDSGDQQADLMLRDNGIGADIRAGDGVYSAQIKWKTVPGDRLRCSCATQAESRRVEGIPRQKAFTLLDSKAPEPTYSPIDELQRSSVPITLSASNGTTGNDVIPPSVIRDLKLLSSSAENGTATIQFTMPGDDFDSGNASYYEVTSSEDAEQLRKFPYRCSVEYRSDSPPAGGSVTQLRLQLFNTSRPWQTYIIVSVFDEENNVASSAPVAVSAGYAQSVSTNSSDSDKTNVYIIAGSVTAAFVAVGIATAVVLWRLRKFRQTKEKQSQKAFKRKQRAARQRRRPKLPESKWKSNTKYKSQDKNEVSKHPKNNKHERSNGRSRRPREREYSLDKTSVDKSQRDFRYKKDK